MKKEIIPIIYSTDENYIPCLAVSLTSLKVNRSKRYDYRIIILHSNVGEKMQNKILKLSSNGFKIKFVSVKEHLVKLESAAVLRDYYTYTTYYRIFIAEMFPNIKKAIYLDCDTVIVTDISKLYNVDVNDYYLAAVPDGAVGAVEPFQEYTAKVLGINHSVYFNAGMLVMNLEKLRSENFYQKFLDLMSAHSFKVAQDQDYLNVLCKDKTLLLDESWNMMPIKASKLEEKLLPNIIHFNLTMKPWHYKGILFEKYFWQHAKETCFYRYLLAKRRNYSKANIEKDKQCESKLIEMCKTEVNDPNNYYNLTLEGAR